MAGLRDTEASFQIEVNGIDKLSQMNEKFDQLVAGSKRLDEALGKGFNVSNSGGNSISRIHEQLEKSISSAQKLNETMAKSSSANAHSAEGAEKSATALEKQVGASERLSQSSSRINDFTAKNAELTAKAASSAEKMMAANERAASMSEKLVTAQSKIAEMSTKAVESQERETAAIKQSVAAANELVSAKQKIADMTAKAAEVQKAASGLMSSGARTGGSEKSEGKITGALKEGASLFAPGMLVASGVMKGAEYVQELFKQGYEYNSEQSGMAATWKTLTEGARGEGVSAHEAGTASDLTKSITTMSRDNGRTLELVNEGYQQMYHATESSDRTKHLVQSELRIGDAMGLSDAQAERFSTYGVGHALDKGKVNGGSLNQMVQYSPAISAALTRAMIADKKKESLTDVSEEEVEKEKSNLRSEVSKGKVSAKMLEDAINYLGDTKFKDAAENAMSSIPGMVRSFKTGLPRMVGDFESSFMEPLGKATSGFFGKATKWINSDESDKWANAVGKGLSQVTVKFTEFAFKIGSATVDLWKKAEPFRTGFADGFVSEFDKIKTTIKDVIGFAKELSDGVTKMFPKDKKKDVQEFANSFGKVTGKVAAFVLALKGLSHLPVIGKTFDGMLGKIGGLASKIPLIGGVLQKIIGGGTKQGSAATKMMSAADTMMAAANKMAGSTGTGGADGVGGAGGKNATKLTMAERYASSKVGTGLSKAEAKFATMASKGGIKGVIGKTLGFGTKLLNGGLGKGAGLLTKLSGVGSKIAGSGIGRFIGGTGKFLGKGAPGINALFAGIDVMGALKNTKAGTNERHKEVGAGVGGGIGGTIGGALGSFLGPLGTIAGGVGGSWLGRKAGGFVGENYNKVVNGTVKKAGQYQGWVDKVTPGLMAKDNPFAKLGGIALKTTAHPLKAIKSAQGGLDAFANSLKTLPFGDFNNKVIKAFTHPVKAVKTLGNAIMHPKKAMESVGKSFQTEMGKLKAAVKDPKATIHNFASSLKSNLKGLKTPKFMQPLVDHMKGAYHKVSDYKNKVVGKIRSFQSDADKVSNALSKGGHNGMATAIKAMAHPLKAAEKGLSLMKKGYDTAKDAGSRFGKVISKMPFANLVSKALDPKQVHKKLGELISHPIKTWKQLSNTFDKEKGKIKNAIDHPTEALRKLRDVGKSAFAGMKLPSGVKGGLKTAYHAAKDTFNFMKDIKNHDFSKIGSNWKKSIGGALNKINPFKNIKMPKFSNPFKNFKFPNIKVPSFLKNIKNPFKGWKLPNLKTPSFLKNIKNPFKNWKMPKIKMPKIPKITNPFKNWKMPKIKFPKMPNWINKLMGWDKGAKKADTSTKKAGNSAKATAKHVESTGKSAQKSGKQTESAFSKAWNKAKSGAKGMASGVGKSLSGVGKIAKSGVSKISSSFKSGFNKAKSSAKSGSKGISNALKSGLKSMSSGTKSAFSKLNSSVKSGMNKSKSSAKSGSKQIGNSVKSGLKTVGTAGKSQFNKLTSSVKSGMNKSKSAAKSGSKGIGTSVKSGLKTVGDAGKSEFNKLSSSVKSGMNKSVSAAKSGSTKIVSSVKSGMSKMGSAGTAAMTSLSNNVKSGMNKAVSSAKSGANNIVNAAKSGLTKVGTAGTAGFNKLSSSITSSMNKGASAATSGMNKISSAITSGLSKAVSVATSAGSKIVSTLVSAFNKAASGASSAVSKISSAMGAIGSAVNAAVSKVRALQSAINGLHSKTVTVTANVEGKGASKLATGTTGARAAFANVPAYANGTSSGHKGGMALVNDGKGSNYREAYMLPNGFIGLFPRKRNMLVNLPAGAHVLSGEDTKSKFGSGLARYATGTTGALDAVKALQNRSPEVTRPTVRNHSAQSVKIDNINITINDNTGNAKNMAKEIAKQVKEQVNAILTNFDSNFEEAGI